MAKRESTESKIISYFSDESDEKVNLLFGIIKGIVAKRTPAKKKAAPAGKRTSALKEPESGDSGRTLTAPDPKWSVA